jgi:hypothetical protein
MALTPQSVAAQCLAATPLPEGYIVKDVADWKPGRLNPYALCCKITAVGPDARQARHCFLYEVVFGADGCLKSARLTEPFFGSLIGTPDTLPSVQVEFPPPHGEIVNGLYLDPVSNQLWTLGAFGMGEYTFDSANRLPDRLKEQDGYKGLNEWMLPNATDFRALQKLLATDDSSAGRALKDAIGVNSHTKDPITVWTRVHCPGQAPASVSSTHGMAYRFSTGELCKRLIKERHPVLLVTNTVKALRMNRTTLSCHYSPD